METLLIWGWLALWLGLFYFGIGLAHRFDARGIMGNPLVEIITVLFIIAVSFVLSSMAAGVVAGMLGLV